MLGVVKAADRGENSGRNFSLLNVPKTARPSVSLLGGARTSSATSASTATRRCAPQLLKEKLQSAGSKQETVGWDTDEASDASTTEADLAVYPPRSRIHCVEGRSEYAYSRAYSAPK